MGDIPRRHGSATWRQAIDPYLMMFESFLAGRLTAEEFESTYLGRYLNDPTAWPSAVFYQLETVFSAVDEFVSEQELRARAGGLDANELTHEVSQALTILSSVVEDRSDEA